MYIDQIINYYWSLINSNWELSEDKALIIIQKCLSGNWYAADHCKMLIAK